MASQSQGIQQLLQAEKRAETMVSDARKRKKIHFFVYIFLYLTIFIDMTLKSRKIWLVLLNMSWKIKNELFFFKLVLSLFLR